MALLKGSAVIGSALGEGIESRRRAALTGFVLARTPEWSKKPFTIRNVPYTAVTPTPLQAAVRYAFGALAMKTRGVPKRAGAVVGDVVLEGKLPPAAEFIQKKADLIRDVVKEAAKALKLPERREVRVALRRAEYQRTVNTIADHETILKQKDVYDIVKNIIKPEVPKNIRAVGDKLVDLAKLEVIEEKKEEKKGKKE